MLSTILFSCKRLSKLLIFSAALGFMACNKTVEHNWEMQVYPLVNFGQFTVRAVGSTPAITAVRVVNGQGQTIDERLYNNLASEVRIAYNLEQGAGTYTIALMSDADVLEHATTIIVKR